MHDYVTVANSHESVATRISILVWSTQLCPFCGTAFSRIHWQRRAAGEAETSSEPLRRDLSHQQTVPALRLARSPTAILAGVHEMTTTRCPSNPNLFLLHLGCGPGRLHLHLPALCGPDSRDCRCGHLASDASYSALTDIAARSGSPGRLHQQMPRRDSTHIKSVFSEAASSCCAKGRPAAARRAECAGREHDPHTFMRRALYRGIGRGRT